MPWPDERGGNQNNKPVKDLIDEAVAKLDAGIAMLNHVRNDVGLRCKANADQAPPAIHGEALKHHADGDPRRVTLYTEVVNWRNLVVSLVSPMINGFNAQLALTELTHPGGASTGGGSQPTATAASPKPGMKAPAKAAPKPAVPAPSKAPAPKPPASKPPSPKPSAAKPPAAPAPKSAPKPPPKPPTGRGR